MPALAVLLAAAVIAVGGFVVVGNASKGPGLADCPSTQTVELAAASDIAPVLDQASRDLEAEQASVNGVCIDYDVQSTAPDLVAEVLSNEPEDSPDLWAPDFSVWASRAQLGGADLRVVSKSLATSPVVVVAPDAKAPASWQEVGMNTVAYLDPLNSSASTVALLAAFGEMQVTGASMTEMGAMMVPLAQRYGGQPDKPKTVMDVAAAAEEGNMGVMTEQQLVRLQEYGDAATLDAVVPQSGTMVLDYPLAAISTDSAVEEAGRLLAGHMAGPDGAELLAAHGFRDAQSNPLESGGGLGEAPYDSLPSPAPDAVTGAMRQWAVLTVPSRLLAVVDVSGSMDFVDGVNSRISLAVTAAGGALELFPDNAQIGMWAFSVNRAPGGRDYETLAPIRPLGSAEGGVPHRQLLGGALKRLPQMTDGGTGLYDTTLAAVRTLQHNYDTGAENSVILLTDGENDDPGSLSIEQLVETIERERDLARPIKVIAIGMGPEADADALRRIAGATGGRSYVARDPEDIGQVFIDAMLSR